MDEGGAQKAALSSALAAVVGPEALPQFLDGLGRYVVDEDQKMCGLLRPVWEKADRHEDICRGVFNHRIQEIAAETKIVNKPQLTIFKNSNISLNTIRGMVRYLSAKGWDDLFGTEPWAAFKPQQSADIGTAEATGRWGTWKVTQKEACFEMTARRLIRSALSPGISIAKVQKVRLARKHAEFASVRLNPDGTPAVGAAGKPITRDSVEDGAAAIEGAPPPQYAPQVIEKEVVAYDGPRVKKIFYRNFRCDPMVPTIEEQPILGDVYEIRVGELQRLYGEGLLTRESFELLKGAAQDVTADEAKKVREDEEATSAHWSSLGINRFVKVGEFELDYEVPWIPPGGAGGEPVPMIGRLWCVVALDTGQVIWCDFLGNITPEGQTHYVNVTSDSDETRLFGISIPDKYEDICDFIDASLNQIVFRNDFAANPPVCYDKKDFKQTENLDRLVFKPGMSLTKTATSGDKPLKELIQVMELPSMEEVTQYLLDLTLRTVQTDSGVSGAAQGDVGSLPQINTATGTKAILGFGSVLHKLALSEIKNGLERVLRKFMDFALHRPAGDEFYTYFEGDVQRQAVMTAAERRRLSVDVALNLSRFSNSEDIQAEAMVSQVIQEYVAAYATMQPAQAQAFRKLIVQRLAKMGMPDAEQLLPMPEMLPPPGTAAPGAAPPPAPGPPPPDEEGGPPMAPVAPTAPTGPAPLSAAA